MTDPRLDEMNFVEYSVGHRCIPPRASTPSDDSVNVGCSPLVLNDKRINCSLHIAIPVGLLLAFCSFGMVGYEVYRAFICS